MSGEPRSRSAVKAQRSCIACRSTTDQERLLRFVRAPDGEVVVDLEGKLPGRGAYCCMNKACLINAVQRRAFSRAFKTEIIPVTADELADAVMKQMQNRILGYIALANKAGKVISGGSMVADALKSSHKPGLVVIAADTSPSIAEKLQQAARFNMVPCFSCLTKERFGDIIGKAPKSALAIKQSGFVAQLGNEIQRYRNFLGEVQ
jgi:predicted RNA-binding protein YlxR (DUF448 family)